MCRERLVGEPSDDHLTRLVRNRLDHLNIKPNERLGQHFLTDAAALATLTNSVSPGNVVIEVGAGIGQVTEKLASVASRVIAIELDTRFEPVLSEVCEQCPNVQIIYGDVLAKNLRDFMPDNPELRGVQIVASLPFHITEPFLHKIKDLPVDDITLVVGQRLVEEILVQNEEGVGFGRLTLLTQTFFEIDILQRISKQKFVPVPRTDASIVRFTPREEGEFRSSQRIFILKKLFDSKANGPSIKTIIKGAIEEFGTGRKLDDKRLRSRYSRRSTKMDLRKNLADYNYRYNNGKDNIQSSIQKKISINTRLPEDLMVKPFDRLDNSELRILSKALRIL